MSKKPINPKRRTQTNFNIWLDPEVNGDHQEALKILNEMMAYVRQRAGKSAALSDHQVKIRVFLMALKALAKNKRPELLVPREDTETMIDWIAAGMFDIQQELQSLATKIENGVVLQAGDLRGMASRIQTGYGDFEQSIADGFMSFDEDEG